MQQVARKSPGGKSRMMINGQHSQGKAVEGKQKDRTEEAKRTGSPAQQREGEQPAVIGWWLQRGGETRFLARCVCPVMGKVQRRINGEKVPGRSGVLVGWLRCGMDAWAVTALRDRRTKPRGKKEIIEIKINRASHTSGHTATLGTGTRIKVEQRMR
ncbi:hypothetical protein P170DRAFT_224553 [Aspergillus steynii IBT 23096]|uniref:Uncharacterized protein n=1 Tax=Aspergillus steynii IBT 23096 TaxID=1392250 RepID=A0A2I2G1T3_9EURO|nr:uncharacterized protein P170DRAFT_224553 [Aspergillus steynii IBT 23096]PLB46834.1 hypothetical protein P170DRAFT_224553 [Aspergillus steynii IBT 23096]